MLELENVRAWYGTTQALFGVDLSLQRGECLALVGANGAGKTSIIRSILGTIRTEGSISLDGRRVDGRPTHRRVSDHDIAAVHEGRGLFYRLSVRENIVVGLPRSEQQSGVEMAVSLFEPLEVRLDDNVSDLSGGQQQMVALARAVARRPKLLLLDEPSLGLAPVIVEEIYGFMAELRRTGLTMLLVEQSIARAKDFADVLCVIRTGRSVATISADDDRAVQTLAEAAFAMDEATLPAA